MKFALNVLLLSTALVFVRAALHCHHEDTSTCTGLVCTDPMQELACEHDQCTCRNLPLPCVEKVDCGAVRCHHHDEFPHCVEGACRCIKQDKLPP